MNTPRHPHPAPPAEAELLALADGLHWARLPLPFALDHVNVWLMRDGDGWVLVDTGVASQRGRDLWLRLFEGAMQGKPVIRVVGTHFHPDHVGLASWICERFGAPLSMARSEWLTARMLLRDTGEDSLAAATAFYRAAGLPPGMKDGLEQRGNAYARSVPGLPAQFDRLAAGQRVRLGGRDWQVVIGGGHSPEHVCLYNAGDRLFIAGDMVLPRISPNVSVWPAEPDAAMLEDFLEALARIRTAVPDDVLVLPSHGLPFTGLHARIDALSAHHADRLAEVAEACREAPRTAADIIALLFRRPLDSHQLAFALGEAVAHLNHLVHAGILARRAGPGGVLSYSAA